MHVCMHICVNPTICCYNMTVWTIVVSCATDMILVGLKNLSKNLPNSKSSPHWTNFPGSHAHCNAVIPSTYYMLFCSDRRNKIQLLHSYVCFPLVFISHSPLKYQSCNKTFEWQWPGRNNTCNTHALLLCLLCPLSFPHVLLFWNWQKGKQNDRVLFHSCDTLRLHREMTISTHKRLHYCQVTSPHCVL